MGLSTDGEGSGPVREGLAFAREGLDAGVGSGTEEVGLGTEGEGLGTGLGETELERAPLTEPNEAELEGAGAANKRSEQMLKYYEGEKAVLEGGGARGSAKEELMAVAGRSKAADAVRSRSWG